MEWNATDRLLHENDESDNHHHHSQDEYLDGEGLDTFFQHFQFGKNGSREAADDTGEDNKRNTVTYTVRSNLFAEVHHEDGTSGEGQGSK